MPTIASQHTFMAGSLARTPFVDQVKAAAEAGYDSITIWPNIWRHALRKQGLTLKEMRAILKDHQIALTDGDAYRDWAPPPTTESPLFGPMRSFPLDEMFDSVVQLGGTTIIAVHLTDVPLNLDRDTAAFAKLCDQAAEHGLRIALEFVAFSNIPDVATALKIVEGAGRKNGGLAVDNWHHVRSTWDDDALRRIPADKVFTIQLSDGPTQAPDNIVEEAMYGRQLPGTGEFDVPGFLKILADKGVQTSIGAELYHQSFENRQPVDVMKEFIAATKNVFAQAGLAWK